MSRIRLFFPLEGLESILPMKWLRHPVIANLSFILFEAEFLG